MSITTSRQIASGKHFRGQMARPRSSHVPMHCRYSKAPTHARFARRLNGEEDACGHEDRLPSVRWRHRRAGERATAVRHARLRCRLPHVVPRAASRASAEARLVLPRLRPSRARHVAATAVDGFTAQAAGAAGTRRDLGGSLASCCGSLRAAPLLAKHSDARPGCVAGVFYGKKRTSRRLNKGGRGVERV